MEPLEPRDSTNATKWPRLNLHAIRTEMRRDVGDEVERWVGHLLGRQLEALFGSLIPCLAEATRLAPAAQWRLIADSVAMAFLEVGQALDQRETAQRKALEILKRKPSPLYNKQLNFVNVAASKGNTTSEKTFVSRGGCCRYYTAPEGSICPSCVLEPPERQRERLTELLKAQMALSLL